MPHSVDQKVADVWYEYAEKERNGFCFGTLMTSTDNGSCLI